MKVDIFALKYVTVTDKCPQCGKTTASDLGTTEAKNLKSKLEMWCGNDDCDQGSFVIDLNWGEELNKIIKEYNENIR